MIETWKPIPGWEDSHEVSDHGRVKSLARSFQVDNGKTYSVKGRFLSAVNDGYGYRKVMMSCKPKRESVFIHKLVMIAFSGPCPQGLEICHTDGNRTNNCLSNLRYDTRVNNQADRLLHGTSNRGSQNGKVKLNEAQVHLTRKLKKGTTTLIAKEWGVTRDCLYAIQKGKRWSHV